MVTELIDGWMGKKSRKWLARRAKRAARIIEVGVWKGRSTAAMAKKTRGTIWAVDHWKGTPDDSEQHEKLYTEADETGDRIYAEFRANLAPYLKAGRVIPVRMPSVQAARYLLGEHGPAFDFVFIDADHSYPGCRDDIEAYRGLIAPGGTLAGHDYHWDGVARAVDEAFDVVTLGPGCIWSVTL